MKRKIAAALLAPLAFAATAVLAADLPRRGPPPVNDYMPPPPALTWSGFYLGIHGGYAFSSFQNGGSRLIGDADGGLIGVTGGYNFMVTPQFLLGAEADFAFAGISATRSPFFGAVARGEVDHLLTVRGRAGFAIDRLLLYASGGLAGSNNSVGLNSPFTAFWGYQSTFQTGWALGGGLEYMLMPQVSAKAEYMFTSVGSDRYFDFSTNALSSGVNTSAVKAGLNYHF